MSNEDEDWYWPQGIFQSWELSIILLGPIISIFIAIVVHLFFRGEIKRLNGEKNNKKLSIFHIEWKARPCLRELVESANSIDIPCRDENRTISSISCITEGEVRRVYPGELGVKVVFFLRLACVLVTSGMSSIEVEEHLYSVASSTGMPDISHLSVGLKEITAQFLLGPVICVSCAADFNLSLLSDAQKLVRLICLERVDVSASLFVLDEIEASAIPYGKLIRYIAMYVVCTLAPATVYMGDYINIVFGAIIAPILLLEMFALEVFGLAKWETPLVSLTTGLLSPILWQLAHAAYDLEQCVAGYTIGVLLIWLPGSSLVYGAHEVLRGSFVNGSARLVKGITQALIIALFYTIGWQYWGRNWASTDTLDGVETNLYGLSGPIVSLPPSISCSAEWQIKLAWYMNSVTLMLPLNLATLVTFNIRPRDCLGLFIVAQATYTCQGVLNNCSLQEYTCSLPYYVQVFIVAFVGGFFAILNQRFTGFSRFGSMLAIIFVLAPGAGAVRSVLGAFHRTEGDMDSNFNTLWESVVFEGVTYAVGFYLAFDLWKPLLLLTKDVHSHNTSNLTSDQNTKNYNSFKGDFN